MKRIFNSIGKGAKDTNFQKKAVNFVEKMESDGTVRVAAPKHASEEAHFRSAQDNQAVKEKIDKKNPELVENMQKFVVNSTNPEERWVSTKDLPSKESEWLHRNDPVWEFGFYEPPEEKIPNGKLMFREAIEILRAKQDLDDKEASPAAAKRREIATLFLSQNKAMERMEHEQLSQMYEYFRPFERKDKQKVVNKHDLAALQDHLQGYSDEMRLSDGAKENMRKLLERDRSASEHYDKLGAKEQDEFREAVQQLRQQEHDRLNERLQQIHTLDVESNEKEATVVNESSPRKK